MTRSNVLALSIAVDRTHHISKCSVKFSRSLCFLWGFLPHRELRRVNTILLLQVTGLSLYTDFAMPHG